MQSVDRVTIGVERAVNIHPATLIFHNLVVRFITSFKAAAGVPELSDSLSETPETPIGSRFDPNVLSLKLKLLSDTTKAADQDNLEQAYDEIICGKGV